MSESLTPSPRPGAPLGNLNALKHGFYARKFTPSVLEDLTNHSFTGMDEEIEMIRVLLRQVVEHAGEAQTLSESLDVLRGASLGTFSLTRMLKIQHYLTSSDPSNPYKEFFDRAVTEFAKESGVLPGQ